MEESKEQQSLHRFLQFAIYLLVLLDILCFVGADYILEMAGGAYHAATMILGKLLAFKIYQHPFYSKLFTLMIIALVSIGTLSRKKKDLEVGKAIGLPFCLGLFFLLLSIWVYDQLGVATVATILWFKAAYVLLTIVGTILLHLALDNMSKVISSKLGKDRWNIEGESFMQRTKPKLGRFVVNIPMLFYFKGKVRKGYVVLENMFRGTLLIGTPGSGKSFGIVMPVIRQFVALEFTLLIYDFKFPDLGKVAYYHYLLARQQGKCEDYDFHVVNLTEPEKSRRLNPWRSEYLQSLADASETAEALVEAMKKGDKSGGSDQFFTQSAINFLASCIYFFAKHEEGRYSSFPHVLAFLNRSYEEIFTVLFSNQELESLLSPFMTAFKARAFDQLEGQVGTLKVFISRLATKETFWVFSGDDFELKISDPRNPSILVLANDPNTQSINSACYSVILNRITRLVNSRGNKPVGLIIDEAPTLYAHKIENLIAQARSNLVAVLLGLQELPQFKQQYGKETATSITAVVGNVLSGSVRNKETLDWLERIFGKVKQVSESLSIDRIKTSLSISERLEPLIPAGKIAALKAGEMVGMLASDVVEDYTGKYEPSAINCRINLDRKAIQQEEAQYRDLPVFYDFGGKKEEVLLANFAHINSEVAEIVMGFRQAANQ